MGLFGKAIDKIAKYDTTYLTYDKLAEIVKAEYIDGADAAFLQAVAKATKRRGGLESPSGKYIYGAGTTTNFFFLMSLFSPKRDVYIREKDTKKYFQLDSSRNYKKFRKTVLAYIEEASK